MKEKEKQLFKALCKFKDEFIDPSLGSFATPSVLGQLFFNRMQGIAFDVLKMNGLLGKVNREFRNSLGAAYEQNVLKNESFRKCVAMLSEILYFLNRKAPPRCACDSAGYPFKQKKDREFYVLYPFPLQELHLCSQVMSYEARLRSPL